MKEKQNTGKGKTIFSTIILMLIVVLICFLFKPLFKSLNFGLDLQGGFEVLYEVESIDGSKMTNEKLTNTYKTLSKRIDSLGVSEPEIIIEGNNKIRVRLAGVTNEEEARRQLSTVATLSFRDSNDNLLMNSDVLKSGGAKVSEDASGNPAVLLSIKDKNKFYSVTSKVKDYSNNVIVIWLDFDESKNSYANEKNLCGSNGSNCLSSATVSQGFASDVIIQGNFSKEEVENLVDLINSGSLPSKLTEISSKTVGASFGDETLSKTLVAGIVGIVLVSLVLIIAYRFAGFIASCSMLVYTLCVFFVFWVMGGVLTLPGIAALVLGIGMAVDANVITYSRIKQELFKGKSLEFAFKEGTKSSISSIIDSNITTLLVAIIMFIFGESSVKGFATMLIITVIVTAVTMILLNRSILKIFVKTKYFNTRTNLFIGVKKEDIPDIKKNEQVKVSFFNKINFLKYSKVCMIISIIVIVVGLVLIPVRGLNLGVDFKSGSDISILTDEKISEDDLKSDMNALGYNSPTISISNNLIDIRIEDVMNSSDIRKVSDYFENKYNAKVDIGVISNVVKRDLIKNAILSIIISFIGIIVYISLRFKFSYALSAVIALLHDILMIIAIFSIFDLEIAVMFVAAILAIVGYSINDTIVLFDRIRENIKSRKNKKISEEELMQICNTSTQETFSRTINTSLTTLLPVLVLIFLGSKEIINFNIAMLIGILAGTYSTIFIATVLFIKLEKRNTKKTKSQSSKYKDEVSEKMIKGINC